jgi:hypothetical protein
LQDGSSLVSDEPAVYNQSASTLILPESHRSSKLKNTNVLNELRTEIFNNLSWLKDVRQQMHERAPSEYFGTSVYKQIKPESFASMDIPSWLDNVWQSVCRGILNKDLSTLLTEREFTKVKGFYDELKMLTPDYIKQNPMEAETTIRRLLNNGHPLL